MELPPQNQDLDMADVDRMLASQNRLIIVLQKRVEQLEQFIRDLPAPLDHIADKDLHSPISAVDGKMK